MDSNRVWILVILLVAACDGPSASDDASVDSSAADASDACMPTTDPFECEDRTVDPSCGGRWVVGLQGEIVRATDGAPIEEGFAQLCARTDPDDTLFCLSPAMSGADGRFAIVNPEEIRCLGRAAMRVLAPGRMFATTYCPVELGAGPDVIVNVPDPYALFGVAAASAPPRGDETMPREVAFDGSVTLTLAPDALVGSGYTDLAGARVDVSEAPCLPIAVDAAYAFAPEGPIEGGAAVVLPNDLGLSPGAQVDLFVLGGLETRLADDTFVEEGELAQFGAGTVSADGTTIVGDADARLPYLSWLAWRAR